MAKPRTKLAEPDRFVPLQAAGEGFRSLVENSPDIIVRYDREARFVYVNPRFEKAIGASLAAVQGKRPSEVSGLSDAAMFEELVRRVMASGKGEKQESWMRLADGNRAWMSILIVPECDAAGQVSSVQMVSRDCTERKEMAQQLELFEAAIHQTRDGIFLINEQTLRFVFVNDAACRSLGYSREELLCMTPLDIDPDVSQEQCHAMIRRSSRGEDVVLETRHRSKGGLIYPVEIRASSIEMDGTTYALSFARNISERRQLEEQLVQARKMEAIGLLAGGIAHDFNNILTPVLMHSEMALVGLTPDSEIAQDLEQIRLAARRGAELVRQILAFSRQGRCEPVPLRLGAIIREGSKLLRSAIPSLIRLDCSIETLEDSVLADPTQMLQILMNLVINAVHAMPENGGVIRVCLDDGYVQAYQSQAGFLRLTVLDNGLGIDAEHLPQIFDPYFTTKRKGEGTGMGLAVVRGIVERHGGTIRVESRPGQGTAFTILIPRTGAPSAAFAPLACREASGDERILLVDDEQAIVKTASAILTGYGYLVSCFTSSRETLAAFLAAPSDFDLLITDQTMPELTGINLCREIWRVRPELPVILCSGFSETVNEESAAAMGIGAFLSKPYSMAEISEAVRRVLDGNTAGKPAAVTAGETICLSERNKQPAPSLTNPSQGKP